MTDNEIMKAFYCCNNDTCENCPNRPTCCEIDITDEILNIINRQKAEIERLQKASEEVVSCFTRMESLYKIKCKELEVAKSEAYREFERKSEDKLIEIYEKYHQIANNTQLKEGVDMFYQGRAEAIWECIDINRGLVKELTEGNK